MSDWTGRYVITYNGEVYNYVELRTELERLGARFTSSCDTEVLANGFAVWGRDCLERLNGMFAFAIYDRVSGELFCARDRLGVKPLRLHGRRASLRVRLRAEGPARGGTRRAEARPRRGLLVHRARVRRPGAKPLRRYQEPAARARCSR